MGYFEAPRLGSISAALSCLVYPPHSEEECGLLFRTAAGNRAYTTIRLILVQIIPKECTLKIVEQTINNYLHDVHEKVTKSIVSSRFSGGRRESSQN